ncbi:carboxypeptidase-like regulatory domain-containing protein [Winogradskyella luteola]|uniref:Carboxypeptidase-like regulatory domain-containing protein n=1 Tax=Winogradskyella luteola TaxID=2828330 RepID=A0A9X1F8X1_9FLAO|nr:carboxypeptidase-like regulatory domain-containing protein [Winogradskyella luteola]MBV7269509.1 carboxypeptidase-like regulatory domain-containing protein [Winogradskyella luteola]
MKVHVFTQKQSFKVLGFIGFLIMALLAFNPAYGQSEVTTTETASGERTVKGVISDEKGPLKDVNIIQKGTRNGTVTNEKGEFTFPVKLNTGDILLITYLGYETQRVKIEDDTTFIDIVLTDDLIEIIGTLDTGKPYKSKRKN